MLTGAILLIVVRRSPSADRGTPANSNTSNVDEQVDYAAVLNALPLGIVIAAADGTVVLRNGVASAAVGLRHVDLLVDAAVDRLLRDTRETGRNNSERLELFGPPPRVLIVSTALIGGGNSVAVIEDVSERTRIDTVRTDFVANISHELKTPVGALSVLAETIQEETDPEVIKRLSTKMVVESHRMADTIDDLLELSKIEFDAPLRHNNIDLAQLIVDAIERNSHAATMAGVTLSRQVADGLFSVTGDRVQLLSAISNLIDNAVKYSEPGDTVTVRLSKTVSNIVIDVVDEGIGIPPADIDRIFERFYRVDKARGRGTGGTGLGLSIVRHIMANHGGEVNVTSQEGEGSCFSLLLPIPVGDNRANAI